MNNAVRTFQVGEKVRLLDIGETDGFYRLRPQLVGLVATVANHKCVCYPNMDTYSGSCELTFDLGDLKRVGLEENEEDDISPGTYYFASASFAEANQLETAEIVAKDVGNSSEKIKPTREEPKFKGFEPDLIVYDEFSATEKAMQDLMKKHPHYYKDVSSLKVIDIYRVLKLFNVTDQCIGHAIKKLLVAGGRGAGKDIKRDLREAIDSINRALLMIEEDET